MELGSEGSFEYSLLNNETRTIVRKRALEIKNLMRLTAQNIINIGQKLTEVKEQLAHGSFQNWLRSEFEWSEQTARQFMQVYRWSETIENKNFVFSRLATSALYLLAAPSTPTEAREEVLTLVDGNEKISYTRVKNIVDRYKHPSEDFEALDTVDVSVEDDVEIKTEVTSNRFLNGALRQRPEGTLHPSGAVSLMGETTPVPTTEGTSATDWLPKTPKGLASLKDSANAIARRALNRLFRLETSELGYIVRLYQAEELEMMTDLNIGSTVKIKVGRWQGQTARIIDVLYEQQLPMLDNEPTQSLSSPPTQIPQSQIKVRIIDNVDLSDREKLQQMSQNLIISYGSTCLAIEGSPAILHAFIEQIKIDPIFVETIFRQALEPPEPKSL